MCKHEARGWRAVALIVQSDLTACGCADSSLLSLYAAGDIVPAVSGAAQEQGAQFQLPASDSDITLLQLRENISGLLFCEGEWQL